MPSITLIIILSVVLPIVLVAITIFFVVRFFLGLISESRQRQSLLRNGERAVAEILSVYRIPGLR
jgi:ABC-type multidrug transport system permease subunit